MLLNLLSLPIKHSKEVYFRIPRVHPPQFKQSPIVGHLVIISFLLLLMFLEAQS